MRIPTDRSFYDACLHSMRTHPGKSSECGPLIALVGAMETLQGGNIGPPRSIVGLFAVVALRFERRPRRGAMRLLVGVRRQVRQILGTVAKLYARYLGIASSCANLERPQGRNPAGASASHFMAIRLWHYVRRLLLYLVLDYVRLREINQWLH